MVLDELITELDRGLRSMTGVSRMSRPLPVPQESAALAEAPELSPACTRRVRMCLMLELTAIVVILPCAALMARGFGYLR